MHTIDLQSMLWNAAKRGDCNGIRIAVAQGADVLACDAFGQNAIHMAIQHGQQDAYKTLQAAADMQRLMTSAVRRAA